MPVSFIINERKVSGFFNPVTALYCAYRDSESYRQIIDRYFLEHQNEDNEYDANKIIIFVDNVIKDENLDLQPFSKYKQNISGRDVNHIQNQLNTLKELF